MNCRMCEQPFTPTRFDQAYCQRACKERAHHQRRAGRGPAPVSAVPVEQRFWPLVKKSSDCLLWTGYVNRRGYGRFNIGQGSVAAHRFAYERVVGPIPTGLTIDHLCRNRACVNPAHLEPVTNAENLRRGRAARQVLALADKLEAREP